MCCRSNGGMSGQLKRPPLTIYRNDDCPFRDDDDCPFRDNDDFFDNCPMMGCQPNNMNNCCPMMGCQPNNMNNCCPMMGSQSSNMNNCCPRRCRRNSCWPCR